MYETNRNRVDVKLFFLFIFLTLFFTSNLFASDVSLKETFGKTWREKMNQPLPDRISCKAKNYYSVQPTLDLDSSSFEKLPNDEAEVTGIYSIDFDFVSNLVMVNSGSEDAESFPIVADVGLHLIVEWPNYDDWPKSPSTFMFSVLDNELLLIESYLPQVLDESGPISSETYLYQCDKFTSGQQLSSDDQFRDWFDDYGRWLADQIISSVSSMVEMEREVLEKNASNCLDSFVEEGFQLFSDELKTYLVQFKPGEVTFDWDNLDPPPPGEWPTEINTLSFDFGECISSENGHSREPETVTPVIIEQWTESCVTTPLPTFFFPDPSKVSRDEKLGICDCLVEGYVDLGLTPKHGLDWHSSTMSFGFEFGIKNPERVPEVLDVSHVCFGVD